MFRDFATNINWKSERDDLYNTLKESYKIEMDSFSEFAESIIPFYGKFYDHQKEGAYYVCNRRHNLLAFEQGLGKTITSADLKYRSRFSFVI